MHPLTVKGAIELSGNNFESSFAGADNEQAVDNFNFAPRVFRPTYMFTDKEDSGRGITVLELTGKFGRGMKQEYHKTQRGQLTCPHRVHEFGMTG